MKKNRKSLGNTKDVEELLRVYGEIPPNTKELLVNFLTKIISIEKNIPLLLDENNALKLSDGLFKALNKYITGNYKGKNRKKILDEIGEYYYDVDVYRFAHIIETWVRKNFNSSNSNEIEELNNKKMFDIPKKEYFENLPLNQMLQEYKQAKTQYTERLNYLHDFSEKNEKSDVFERLSDNMRQYNSHIKDKMTDILAKKILSQYQIYSISVRNILFHFSAGKLNYTDFDFFLENGKFNFKYESFYSEIEGYIQRSFAGDKNKQTRKEMLEEILQKPQKSTEIGVSRLAEVTTNYIKTNIENQKTQLKSLIAQLKNLKKYLK